MRNEYLKTLFRMSCDSGADSLLRKKEKSAHIRAINYGNFASSPFLYISLCNVLCVMIMLYGG